MSIARRFMLASSFVKGRGARRVAASVVVAAAAALPMRALAAQTAVIAGTVVRDSSGAALGEVTAAIAALDRSVRTNFMGEFRLDGLQAGTYVVTFRRVGFSPRADTITVTAGQVVDEEFIMKPQPVQLDSQRVVAESVAGAPYLREFEERRKLGFGRFIDEKKVRSADNKSFVDFVVSSVPGLSMQRVGSSVYLKSGRKACNKPAFQCTGAEGCMVSVYIDGVSDYVSGVSNQNPTDFTQLKSEDFAAIEYYPSGATAPSRFNQTGSDCGMLLLWRRYR